MKNIYFAAASAALMAFTLSVGEAAPRPKEVVPATQGRTMLEQIDGSSASIADAAYRLAAMAKSQRDPMSHLARLNDIREEVNQIGRELQALDDQRASLTEWEAKALDQALPLMHEIAVNAQKATETYISDRTHLFATSYPPEMLKVSDDATQVKQLLDGYLKLASVRQQEQRLEVKVGEVSGTR